jgi:hypothetical protein
VSLAISNGLGWGGEVFWADYSIHLSQFSGTLNPSRGNFHSFWLNKGFAIETLHSEGMD